jgi:uncharacterized cupredoxin-like copper-binding protein
MENTPKKSMSGKSSRKALYALVLIIIAVVVIVSVYYYQTTLTPPAGSGTSLSLYVGEVTTSQYGFGNTASSLTSNPGPTLTLTADQTYTMTVHNVGTMQHNWAIVDARSSSANVLWGAVVASAINPGSTGEVTFKAGSAGSYFYICQVPGHVSLGLWGTVTVNP